MRCSLTSYRRRRMTLIRANSRVTQRVALSNVSTDVEQDSPREAPVESRNLDDIDVKYGNDDKEQVLESRMARRQQIEGSTGILT